MSPWVQPDGGDPRGHEPLTTQKNHVSDPTKIGATRQSLESDSQTDMLTHHLQKDASATNITEG